MSDLNTTQDAGGEGSRLESWPRGLRTPFPADKTLPQLFAESVEKNPSAVAVIEGDESFTYAELDSWSERIAAVLRRPTSRLARASGCRRRGRRGSSRRFLAS